MNQGGQGFVSSSLGAGTRQCSWSLPTTTAGNKDKPISTSHQMNICRAVDPNLSITVLQKPKLQTFRNKIQRYP